MGDVKLWKRIPAIIWQCWIRRRHDDVTLSIGGDVKGPPFCLRCGRKAKKPAGKAAS